MGRAVSGGLRHYGLRKAAFWRACRPRWLGLAVCQRRLLLNMSLFWRMACRSVRSIVCHSKSSCLYIDLVHMASKAYRKHHWQFSALVNVGARATTKMENFAKSFCIRAREGLYYCPCLKEPRPCKKLVRDDAHWVTSLAHNTQINNLDGVCENNASCPAVVV